MLNGLEEAAVYELSDTLGVEIYLLGVGGQAFLPKQYAAPGSVSTREGATAEWMMAALENPGETAWWVHTHPGMDAFFSMTDEEGAHSLWEAVKRPLFAFVLGENGSRHEEIIDEEWVKAHPKRAWPKKGSIAVLPPYYGYGDDGYHWDGTQHRWLYGGRTTQHPVIVDEEDDLLGNLARLIGTQGWEAVRVALDTFAATDDPQREAERMLGWWRREWVEGPAKGDGGRVTPGRSEEDEVEWAEREYQAFLIQEALRGELCLKCGTAPEPSKIPGICGRCGNQLFVPSDGTAAEEYDPVG